MTKKVTFILSADIVADATEGLLLGEFNNWDKDNGFTLTKQKDGSLKTTLPLEVGKTYEYRYLLNDGRWVNDERAGSISYANGYQVENCVVVVPAQLEETITDKPKTKSVKVKTAKDKAAVVETKKVKEKKTAPPKSKAPVKK